MTCRRLERRWRPSRLTFSYQSYTDQRTVVKHTIFKSKMDYFSSLLYSAESDSTITRVLQRKAYKRFPNNSSVVDLANKFIHFFEEKIVNITFKVLLLTFKALNNLAPPYLSQLIVPYNPTRNLRSASKHLLEVPSVRLKSYGDRAFSVAAPKHWNDIPLDIKLSGSVDVFKSRLKTYLFRLAFS